MCVVMCVPVCVCVWWRVGLFGGWMPDRKHFFGVTVSNNRWFTHDGNCPWRCLHSLGPKGSSWAKPWADNASLFFHIDWKNYFPLGWNLFIWNKTGCASTSTWKKQNIIWHVKRLCIAHRQNVIFNKLNTALMTIIIINLHTPDFHFTFFHGLIIHLNIT